MYSRGWLENWNGQNNDILNVQQLDGLSVLSPGKGIGPGQARGSGPRFGGSWNSAE